MDLKNMIVNCAKVAVAWGMADANVNIELAPDVSMCCGCLTDVRDDCGDADYPMDFVHLIEGTKGHVDCVYLVQE
jgi:hypothetical protein